MVTAGVTVGGRAVAVAVMVAVAVGAAVAVGGGATGDCGAVLTPPASVDAAIGLATIPPPTSLDPQPIAAASSSTASSKQAIPPFTLTIPHFRQPSLPPSHRAVPHRQIGIQPYLALDLVTGHIVPDEPPLPQVKHRRIPSHPRG